MLVSRRRNISLRLAAVLAIALAALVAVPDLSAHPPALIGRNGKPIYGKRHRWLHQSKMPLVGGTIHLISSSCPGRPRFSGCIFLRRPRTLYLRPGALNPKSVVYHELGHVFDLTLLRHRDRKAFKRVLGLGRRGWFAGPGPPDELFAEAYAFCARFGMRRPALSRFNWTRSQYGYRPSRRQHHRACLIIARAGAKERQRAKPKPQPPANPPPVFEEKPPQQPPPQGGQPGGGGLPGLPLPPLPLVGALGF